MSGRICAMFNCCNYSAVHLTKSFHRFPRDSELCKRWVIISKRADLDTILKEQGVLKLNSTYFMCSDHFDAKDFKNPGNKSQGLKKNIVPTLNLPFEKKVTTRPSPKKRKLDTVAFVDHTERVVNSEIPNTEDVTKIITNVRENSNQVEIEPLKKKIRRLQNVCYKRKQIGKKLLEENKKLKKELQAIKKNKQVVVLTEQQKFVNSQLRLSSVHKQGRRYTTDDKSFALGLYYCSTNAYKFMQKQFCLPTIRSLRRYLQNLDIHPGLNQNILQMLEIRAKVVDPKDRLVSIVIDEIALKRSISYNSRNDVFYGFQDFGAEIGQAVVQELEPCDQALVVMIRSLTAKTKQVIGYFLSKGATPGDFLRECIVHCIRKVRECGFIPKVVVCDQGSNNLKMRALLGVTRDKPYIDLDGNSIYFFHDPPHLLKSVRNNLKKYVMRFRQETYLWSHVEEFYNKDIKISPRLAPKLLKNHIILPPFSPMRVCLAAQVFSHSVSAGILTHVSFNSMGSAAAHTAKFITLMDNLFDCFNSINLNDSKIFRRALKENSPHWDFLAEADVCFRELIIQNSTGNAPPCIIGWRENINALKLLFEDLQQNFDVKFLMTRRLTQDCIENLFSVIRLKGGNNTRPDAEKFRSALRASMCNQILAPSPYSNCEIDYDTFLIQKNHLQTKKLTFAVCQPNIEEMSNTVLSCPTDIIAGNALAYVTGWVCSNLCKSCQEIIATTEDLCDSNTIHIAMKKYENATLLFPKQYILDISYNFLNIFKTHFKDILKKQKSNVKTVLKQLMKLPPDCGLCTNCQEVFVEKFLNVNINAFVKEFNENISKKFVKKPNLKAQKVMHL